MLSPMLLALAAGSVLAPLSIGLASRDLTPPEPLPLGGYTARKGAVSQAGDKLEVKVLALQQGQTKIVVASFEGLTIPESFRKAVADRLGPDVRLFLAATHTHCAPDTQMLNSRMTFRIPGIAVFSQRWLTWYACQTTLACEQALKQLAPANHLALRQAKIDLNRARRDGGTPDKTASELLAEGQPVVAHYAAHGTFYDSDRLQTSGDWPGAVKSETGALVLPGAIGDVSPQAPGDGAAQKIAAFSRLFKAGLDRAPAKNLEGRLTWLSEPVALDKVVPHPDFARENKINDAMAGLVVGKFAPTEGKLSAVVIGKLVLLGVPGEPSGALGFRLQAPFQKGGYTCLVTSHCNGWIGYVMEPAEYDKGGYESTLMFHGRGTADRLVEAAQRLASRLPKAS